ncbi:MAG: hypothetical protein KatS3mg105_4389 [Gemmatales bacterium]|nr:MAG: hypothetical protein KatS3mg105_4389 [Gemmatales bacterium]
MKLSATNSSENADWGEAWSRFWFTPVDPIGLHVIRVLTGLLLLGWLFPFASSLEAFFSLQGWFDSQAYIDLARLAAQNPDVEKPGWSLLYLVNHDPQLVTSVYWVSIVILILFTLGFCTRITSVLTWLIVASFTSNPVMSYGGDVLLGILAFYLMVGYLLVGWQNTDDPSLWRILGSRSHWLFARRQRTSDATDTKSYAANLALRLLQVHIAIVLVTSGLHKLQFPQWWSGDALWYPLHPAMETTLADARSHVPYRDYYLGMLSIGTYAALFWQIGFPLFAWRPRWRPVVLVGAVIGWLSMAFLYRLPLFGPAIFIGCLSFVPADDFRRLAFRLADRFWHHKRQTIAGPATAVTTKNTATVSS